MASVLFFDKASVVEAYESRGIDVWSISEGKSLMAAGSGTEELSKILCMLEKNRVPARYILRVYNNESDPDAITNKTENNGEFTFKLDPGAGAAGAAVSGVTYVGSNPADILAGKIHEALSRKVGTMVDELLEGKKEEPKPTIGDFVMGFIEENPNIVVTVLDKLAGIFKPAVVAAPALAPVYNMAQPAAVGTVAPGFVGDPEINKGDTGERLQRLANALDRLEKCDPNLVEHIEKLATLAETKPETYKMALTFLK